MLSRKKLNHARKVGFDMRARPHYDFSSRDRLRQSAGCAQRLLSSSVCRRCAFLSFLSLRAETSSSVGRLGNCKLTGRRCPMAAAAGAGHRAGARGTKRNISERTAFCSLLTRARNDLTLRGRHHFPTFDFALLGLSLAHKESK